MMWQGDVEHIKRGGQHTLSDIRKTVSALEQSDTNQFWKECRIAHVQSAWESIMPEEVLSHTDGVYLIKKEDGQHMTVYVDSSIWAADLSAQSYMVLSKMERELSEQIEDLRFIVSSETYRRKKHTEFRKHADENPSYIEDIEPVALTDSEIREIHEQAQMIEDEKLREMLVIARIHDLSAKKGLEASKRR